MVKKTKSKARLDKYYQLAKDQGYRSRAAFKLIQLNRKYNFLNQANTLVDLCAAPGGWLQVASSVMPIHSTILGLDLVSIRPIPGCKTFQQDITTPQCVQLLKKELKGNKADVFLHDGAPNVGAAWSKDAYNQNELVLVSLKLACKFLRKGGLFVTKVFRSADYNSLIWVFNKFFGKVEATKPTASRFVSAEIFIVCLDYFAPEYIDEKLFDTQYIFKDSEADLATVQMQKEINSVDKILQKRRRRTGYSEDAPLTVYKSISLRDFCLKENPYSIFIENNKIDIKNDDDLFQLAKPPKDYEYLIDDIQVLGKREIIQLLKWRTKINSLLKKEKKEFEKAGEDQEGGEEEEELEDEIEDVEYFEEDENNLEENDVGESKEETNADFYREEVLFQQQQEQLDEQLLKDQKVDLKEQRRRREKKQQTERKLHGIDTFGGMEDDQELFDIFKHKKLQNLGYEEPEQEEKQKDKKAIAKYDHVDQLDENLEVMYEMRQKKKRENQEKEQQARQEKQLKKRKHLEGYEEEAENEMACEPEISKKIKLLDKKFYSNELYSNLKNQLQEGSNEKFSNPLKVKQKKVKEQKKDSEEEEQSEQEETQKKSKASKLQRQVQNDLDDLNEEYALDQDEESEEEVIDQDAFPDEDRKVKMYELQVPKSEMAKRREKLKKKREKEQKKLNKNKEDEYLLNKGEFDVVPEKKLEDYNIDELATNLALAKKIIKKNIREKIVDKSFNRLSALIDHDEELPEWFKDDEQKHNFKIDPISKEEFQQEKQRLMAINARVPKKVMEAKIRNIKQLQKRMQKASRKAQQVLDQDGLDDRVKMKEVEKIYKKSKIEATKAKEKKYIVAKKGSAQKMKSGRFTRIVDSRLKKDKRAEKNQKKQKDNGIRQKIKKRQKKHVKRRKARKQKS